MKTSVFQEIKTLYHLTLSPVRGQTHAERLESFYSKQAIGYDDFRHKLLQGRRELYQAIDVPANGVWIEMGGGTGSNLEFLREKIAKLKAVYIVDLAPSLLAIADERIKSNGWTNVHTVLADVGSFKLPNETEKADVITFSYSLTMIPRWFKAVDRAIALLRDGGKIGVVDFYISPQHPDQGRAQHNAWTRNFWRLWFGMDQVNLSPDHLDYLTERLTPLLVSEHRASVPYLPWLGKVPYYRFIGQKRTQ